MKTLAVVLLLLLGSVQAIQELDVAFVIDTTSSMSNAIAGAIKGCEEILSVVSKRTDITVRNYILSLFNDPTQGTPVYTYSDMAQFVQRLRAITVEGGGDCPEECFKGVVNAMEVAVPASMIFVFTDATTKQRELESTILQHIREKHLRLFYVLTGNCDTPTSEDFLCYERTAAASGGHAFITTPGEIQEVLRYLEAEYGTVEVDSLDYNIQPGADFKVNVSFPVDTLLQDVYLSVSGPQIIFKSHSGAEYESLVALDTFHVVRKHVSTTGGPDGYGVWWIEIEGRNSLSSATNVQVRISGRGVDGGAAVEFRYGFSTVMDAAVPFFQPIADVPVFALCHFENLKAPGHPVELHFTDLTGESQWSTGGTPMPSGFIDKSTIRPNTHSPGYEYIGSSVTLPNGRGTRVKAFGIDAQGIAFQRISKTSVETIANPCEVKPCGQHGVCTANGDPVTKFSCSCTDGYIGQYCDREDVCTTQGRKLCSDHGECFRDKSARSYTCECDSGYEGQNCEVEAHSCCYGHGDISCSCHPGYSGVRCDNKVTFCNRSLDGSMSGPTLASLCRHGHCEEMETYGHCVCDEGWTGATCSTPGGTWIQAHRCYLHEPKHTALPGVPVGCHEPTYECVPDDLQCFYPDWPSTPCEDPIGWCIPADEGLAGTLRKKRMQL